MDRHPSGCFTPKNAANVARLVKVDSNEKVRCRQGQFQHPILGARARCPKVGGRSPETIVH